MLLIATAQSKVSVDVRENGKEIRRLMREASGASAKIIHFAEAALSGYVKSQIKSWSFVDWNLLEEELESIKALAKELKLWTVFGCNQQSKDPKRPYNSLCVISDEGAFYAKYDKRLCSNTEINDWYTPGDSPCVFTIDNIRFGCLICIEIQFPELFMEYERLDVDCVLFSTYSDNPMFVIQAQGHAACNSYWISFSAPTNFIKSCPGCLIGPDGSILSKCAGTESDLSVCKIDPNDPEMKVPVRYNRPWRRKARSGDIYEAWRK